MKKQCFLLSIFMCAISCTNNTDTFDIRNKHIGLSTHEVIFTSDKDSILITSQNQWFVSDIYNITKDTLYNIEWTASGKQQIEEAGLFINKTDFTKAIIYNRGLSKNDSIIIHCHSANDPYETEQLLIILKY